MLYIPKIDYYCKIMTDEEMKDFVAINSSEYFKSIRKQNLRKVAKSLYIFLTTLGEVEKDVQSNSSDNCTHHYNVENLNLFNPESQLINTKPVIKNKFKELLRAGGNEATWDRFKTWAENQKSKIQKNLNFVLG